MTDKLIRFRVLLLTFGLLMSGVLYAQNGDTGIPPIDMDDGVEEGGTFSDIDADRAREISQMQEISRQEQELRARGFIDRAQAELAKGTISGYENAADLLGEAEQLLKTVSATKPSVRSNLAETQRLYAMVVREWADLLVRQGEQMAAADQLDDAEELYRRAANTNEEMRPLIAQRLRRLQEIREAVNLRDQTRPEVVDPERVERDRDIAILLEQGKVFYRNRRYMDARDRFESVLIRDPYNSEATRYLREIYEELSRDAKDRRHAMIRERISEIEWKWNDPVAPVEPVVTRSADETRRVRYGEDEEGIQRKLSQIIIPRISFEDATIQTVVTFIKQRSRELDVEGEGINVILRLLPSGGAPGGGQLQEAEQEADEFSEDFSFDNEFGDLDLGDDPTIADDPFAPGGGTTGGQATGGQTRTGDDITITIDMDNIPLGEALRYITQGAGLKLRVEEHAVIIADPRIPIDELETRFYPIDAGFLRVEVTRQRGGFDTGDDDDDDDGGGRGAVDPREFFTSLGIDFPQGASIRHDPRTSKLIVTNTPENLRKVEDILRELNIQPTQVTVEAKFVEIRQTSLEQLGFTWLFQGVRQGNGNLTDYNHSFSQGLQFSLDAQGDDENSGSLSAGIDSSVGGVSRGNLLAITSIIDDLQFRTLIYAIDQMDGTDLLSSPKVTTTSGETAVIDFVQERRFPESFTEPEITTGTAGNVSVTPSTPEFGDAEEIGVIFRVTPTVAADGYSIGLELEPVVREFIGFDTTYNTQTLVEGVSVPFRFDTPIFERRSVQTSVIVWDGETVVLGGTIRDKIDKRNDRVPWLSDLPLFGRLFKMEGELSEKRNLLVFVSARLVNPAGLPIRPSDIRGLPDFRR